MVQESSVADKPVSALRDSVARKGNNSYYYAWDKLDLSKQDEYKPRLVRTDDATVEKLPTTMTKYAWSDEGRMVKVYADLKGVGRLAPESVLSSFRDRSFVVDVIGLDKVDYRLAVGGLDGDIDPSKCQVQVKRDMIIVVLHKHNPDHKWFSLSKK